MRKSDRAGLLVIGIFFAWVAVLIMLTYFYEGLVEVQVSVIQGGPYRPNFLKGDVFLYWIFSVALSSIFLGWFAYTEMKEPQDEVVKKFDDITERLEEISEKLSKRSEEAK